MLCTSQAEKPAMQASSGAGEAANREGRFHIAFDKENFEGDHTHIFGDMPKLGKWDNSISSMIILSGTWEFFNEENSQGKSMAKLGPGKYANVTPHGLKDNSISSIRLVSPREHLSK